MNERIPENSSEGIRPYVKPGQPLGYMQRLQARQAWPPPKWVRQGPTLYPYLVIPAFEGDTGSDPNEPKLREWGDQPPPHPTNEIHPAFNFWGVRIARVEPGYAIQCYVHNLGPMASYGGLAVFYVGYTTELSPLFQWFPKSWTPIGYAGFTAMPGATVTVDCPHHWQQPDTLGLDLNRYAFLVQAYDPFTDPVQSLDPYNDRHVGAAWINPPASSAPEGP